MKITEKWLKDNTACQPGIDWFNDQSETDAEKLMIAAVESDNADYLEWMIEAMLNGKKIEAVKVAVFAAELVIDIFEKEYPDDKRPRKAIEAAVAWIDNPCGKTGYAGYGGYAAAKAAAYAGYAAAYAYAAADSERSKAHEKMCAMIRERLKLPKGAS